MTISGTEIEGAFRDNFASREELGAAVSIWRGEEEVVSLSGGFLTREKERAWERDTLVPIFSATKAPAGLTVLIALHEAGLSIHEKVSALWPTLKAARESGLTFAELLSHRSGLAALSPENRPSIHQHEEVVRALERQDPNWEPGDRHGYHPRTGGALYEEIVRKITGGQTLGALWREKVGDPLGIDVFIGDLSSKEVDRLATIYAPKRISPPTEEEAFYRAMGDAGSLSSSAFASPGGLRRHGDVNRLEYLQAGIPSMGGVASAQGLGKFYAILANRGRWRGVQVVPEAMVDQLSHPVSKGEDQVLLIPTAFSPGFMTDPVDEASGEKMRRIFGPSHRAFGQPGAGGSLGFADPENGIAFAYVMNQMETGILPNEKSLGLVKLLYP